MEIIMASTKQKTAARRNIKKAASAAKRKRTISKLPKKTRTALGKQGAKVARQKRSRSR
jgi:ABC-type transport system involved in Fe-S cluster assembly fused permease/ATPase subunit